MATGFYIILPYTLKGNMSLAFSMAKADAYFKYLAEARWHCIAHEMKIINNSGCVVVLRTPINTCSSSSHAHIMRLTTERIIINGGRIKLYEGM